MAKTAPPHPGWDPRIASVRQPLSQVNGGPDLPNTQIKRGYIKQDQPFSDYKKDASGQIRFHFQYNPSTIQASMSVQQTGAALTYLYANPNDVANLAAPVNGAVSFTVLYDRTYDLWGSYNTDGTPKNANSSQMQQYGNDPRVVGAYADIMQLMYLTGVFETGANSGSQLGGTDSSGNSVAPNQKFDASTGFMMMVPSWLYFGPQAGSITYYGYISEWSYTVTHWSQFMVPMRCAIDLNFAMLPPPANNNPSSFSPANLTPSNNSGLLNKLNHLAGIPGV